MHVAMVVVEVQSEIEFEMRRDGEWERVAIGSVLGDVVVFVAVVVEAE